METVNAFSKDTEHWAPLSDIALTVARLRLKTLI